MSLPCTTLDLKEGDSIFGSTVLNPSTNIHGISTFLQSSNGSNAENKINVITVSNYCEEEQNSCKEIAKMVFKNNKQLQENKCVGVMKVCLKYKNITKTIKIISISGYSADIIPLVKVQ